MAKIGVAKRVEVPMRVSGLMTLAFWMALLPWSGWSLGQEQPATPSRKADLPDDPVALSQRLVKLGWARFDHQCKAFGIEEVLETVALAHRLQMAAACVDDNDKAELAAAEELYRETERILATVENRCHQTSTPIVDCELARYRFHEAEALVAQHSEEKSVEIECRKRAVAAAMELRRALISAYKAGVLPWPHMLKLAWYPCEARITLADLTTDEPTQLAKMHVTVLEELLELADGVIQSRLEIYTTGFASLAEVELAMIERSRIAARLAEERGDVAEELAALQKIVDFRSARLRRAEQLSKIEGEANLDREKAEWQFHDAQVQLRVARLAYEGQAAGNDPSQIEIGIMSARRTKMEADSARARVHFLRVEALYSKGHFDEFTLVEAAVLARLTDMSLRQCRLDLERLQKRD